MPGNSQRIRCGELSPEMARRRFLLARARQVLAKEPLARWQVVERFGLSELDAWKLVREVRRAV